MGENSYTTLEVKQQASTLHVLLDRPDVRNAFDDTLIAELTQLLNSVAADESIRVMTLSGKGSVFSAGADLNWMKKVAQYSHEENVEDARLFARMLELFYRLPKATIAKVNGPCIGGGVGLVAVCDVAVSANNADFALREILLGIAPAVISPYVLRKIGPQQAQDYFLTGRRFDAERAAVIGLVNEVVDPSGLDEAVARWEKRFLHAGPNAVAVTKQLINTVAWSSIRDAQAYTAETIAKLRGSDEGQEGFAAFFEKRKPNWDVGE